MMTDQFPERLNNDCPAVDFGDLHLYGIRLDATERGDPWSGKSYDFSARGTPDKRFMCTALWRGYVSVYRLGANGGLVLEAFEYPFHRGRASDSVNEPVTGNFWLVLKRSFRDFGVFVPFRDGRVIEDRAQWLFEIGGDRFASGSEFPAGATLPSRQHYEETLRRQREAEAVTLIVTGDASLVLAQNTLYVDRNYARTVDRGPVGQRDNSVHVHLPPGAHTLTLREGLVHQPDRQASNTLQVELRERERLTVRATRTDGRFCLQVEDESESPGQH